MEYSFFVPGRPRPKERPRNRKGHWYTPERTVEGERAVREAYAGPEFTGPVRIDMAFTRDGTHITIADAEWSSPLVADIDNLVKLVQDALQGVAFQNDRSVVAISAEKS